MIEELNINWDRSVKNLITKNLIFSRISKSSLILVVLFVISFFSYIFYNGIQGFLHYGWTKIFWSKEFNLTENNKGVSFLLPLSITIFLAATVIIMTIPISIRISIWICFYSGKKVRQLLDFLIILTSNIPSIIMGLFVREHMGTIIQKIFFLEKSLNLVAAIFALHFMVLPICVLFFNAALKENKKYILSSQVLGISKNYSIYKVLIPKIRKIILFTITVIFGRIISESIMLSLILSSDKYSESFNKGILGFLNSDPYPISPLISKNFVGNENSEEKKNLMFFFSGMILILFWTFNYFFYLINKPAHDSKISKWISTIIGYPKKLRKKIKFAILWQINKWETGEENIKKIEEDIKEYILIKRSKNTVLNLCTYIRKFWEWFSISMFLIFISSLILTILNKGGVAVFTMSTMDSSSNTLRRAAFNTLVIIICSLILIVPISMLAALYLSEYSKNQKIKKFLLNILNFAAGTPSIIYGLFGASFFIFNLGLATGSENKSLLAGILTISLLIIPNLTQMFYAHFDSVPQEYRISSYSLGMTKYQTIKKIIIPLSLTNMLSSLMINAGKIIGETAPFYLTAGLTSTNSTSFLQGGQTLTTRIYSLFKGNSNGTGGESSSGHASGYENNKSDIFRTAIIIFIFVSLVIYVSRVIIPYCARLWKYPIKIIWIYYRNKWNYFLKRIEINKWKIRNFFFKLLL